MRSRNETMPPLDEGNTVAGARRLFQAEAEATKQAMKAGAQRGLTAHFQAALEKIAYHDYGQLHPPFDPQEAAIEALTQAGVLACNPRFELRSLGDLLARIHRDGGQYVAKHGWAKALADADKMIAALFADSDMLSRGFVMVPVVPTADMVKRGVDGAWAASEGAIEPADYEVQNVWREMVSAAPKL
jgi:hypothetical protein